MAGWIKKQFPACKIYFLGRSYTKDVIALSSFVDEFINYDDLEKLQENEAATVLKNINADVFLHVFPVKKIAQLAKKAGVQRRVGTTNRFYHWFTCNKLIRLSRKNSPLHEAQLNMKLLDFLTIDTNIPVNTINNYYGFNNVPVLHAEYKNWIDPDRLNVILHPKSKGSAKEWGLDNFSLLIKALPPEKFKIFISGTDEDGKQMKELISANPSVSDLTGKLSLQQFIAFIYSADALIAASTGPLHIAAALGKKAIGLFSPRRPIHPGRWAPLGKNAHYLVFDENCKHCADKKDCDCISRINPSQIVDLLNKSERV